MERIETERYIVNEAKKIVVCIVETTYGYRTSGVAKCMDGDVFNENVGKEIARLKALIKIRKRRLSFLKEDKRMQKEYIASYTRNVNELTAKCNKVEMGIERLQKDIERIVNEHCGL